MVSTRPVAPLLRPEGKISHMALDDSSDTIAWVEGAKTVRIGRLENDAMIEVDTTFSTHHRVSYLGFHREGLVVGDDLASLMFYDLEGNLVEEQAIDGGVQTCHAMGLKVVVLSGMGELHLDIAHHRLTSEFGVQPRLGHVRVGYRETLTEAVEATSDEPALSVHVALAPAAGEQQVAVEERLISFQEMEYYQIMDILNQVKSNTLLLLKSLTITFYCLYQQDSLEIG